MDKETTKMLAELVAAAIASALPAAVEAAVKAVRAEDDRRVAVTAKTERDRVTREIRDEKARAELEAGRPPRRRDVQSDEVDEMAKRFRAGSTVRIRPHRRMRARFWRDDDDRGEPMSVRSLVPDETVDLPIDQVQIANGQTSREMAHAAAAGFFELAS